MSKATLQQNGNSVAVQGQLTVDNVGVLFASKLDYAAGNLDIDLSALTEVDSAGIALLVYWHQQGNSRQCKIEYSNVDAQVATMMRISNLESMIARP